MRQQPFDFRALLARGAVITPSHGAPVPWTGIALGFFAGLPDPASVPVDDLMVAAERVLRRDGVAALQYGGYYGYEGLRDYLVEKVRKEDGCEVQREQVILTSGSAHALSLACIAFVNPGDTVLVEAPAWGWFLQALRGYAAKVVAVPIDEEGLRVDLLEGVLARLRREGVRPKFLYTQPNFQNPAGVTMALERRRRLARVAAESGLLVIEDNVYGDLRYEGDPLPSLLSMDERGLVLKVGSFSKVVATGLRVGWAVGHADVVAAMVSIRHDLGISPFLARTVAEYIAMGKLEPHVQKLITLYRRKRDTMAAALGEHCGPRLRWRKPGGGFCMWLETAPGIDPGRLAAAAAEEGVGYSPGASYYVDGAGRNQFRMAFSSLPAAEIERGVAGLGRALEKASR